MKKSILTLAQCKSSRRPSLAEPVNKRSCLLVLHLLYLCNLCQDVIVIWCVTYCTAAHYNLSVSYVSFCCWHLYLACQRCWAVIIDCWGIISQCDVLKSTSSVKLKPESGVLIWSHSESLNNKSGTLPLKLDCTICYGRMLCQTFTGSLYCQYELKILLPKLLLQM